MRKLGQLTQQIQELDILNFTTQVYISHLELHCQAPVNCQKGQQVGGSGRPVQRKYTPSIPHLSTFDNLLPKCVTCWLVDVWMSFMYNSYAKKWQNSHKQCFSSSRCKVSQQLTHFSTSISLNTQQQQFQHLFFSTNV